MPSIVHLRRRVPVVVFILLLVLLVVALGLICLCATAHPAQTADRALSSVAHAPAVIAMWSFLMLLSAPLFRQPSVVAIRGRDRASPAALQRFLF